MPHRFVRVFVQLFDEENLRRAVERGRQSSVPDGRRETRRDANCMKISFTMRGLEARVGRTSLDKTSLWDMTTLRVFTCVEKTRRQTRDVRAGAPKARVISMHSSIESRRVVPSRDRTRGLSSRPWRRRACA